MYHAAFHSAATPILEERLGRESTLRIAADILTAALHARTITLLPDPKTQQSSAEHDSAQIARAFLTIHGAVAGALHRP